MSLATASLVMEMRIHHSGRKCAKNEKDNVDRDQINIFMQTIFQEMPQFLLEPSNYLERSEENFYNKEDAVDGMAAARGRKDSYLYRDQMNTRAGMQNVLQLFVTNAANVFLLEVSPEYPILLEEQVEMCKRVLNIYR